MHSTIVFVVLAGLLAVAFASTATTSPSQQYFESEQAQIQMNISMVDMKVMMLNKQAANNVKLIGDQNQLVLQEIQTVQASLVPTTTMTTIQQSCVKAYQPLLLTYNSVQTQFAACISTLQAGVDSLTTSATSNINDAKTAVNTNLPAAVASCNANYANDETELMNCVQASVASCAQTVQGILSTVAAEVESGTSTLASITQTALGCSFTPEKTSLVNIGKVLDLIDSCSN